MKVTADDVTKILVISGGAAVSGRQSRRGRLCSGGCHLKDCSGTHRGWNRRRVCSNLRSRAGVTVKADPAEQLWLFVMGLGGGKSAAVSGSVGVVVISNQVEAHIGSYTRVGNAGNRGNVSVIAADNMLTVVVAGGVAVSASSAAVGCSNLEMCRGWNHKGIHW